MQRYLTSLPLFVLLMGAGAFSMILPSILAVDMGRYAIARDFFYAMLLFLILAVMIGMATINTKVTNPTRSHLFTLLATFLVLPVMLAVPFHRSVGNITFLDAWFEMVSCLTTTGATLFDNPYRLAMPLHLWRAEVGWLGGLFVWVAFLAILAPLNLGGFEVRAAAAGADRRLTQITKIADPAERLFHFFLRLAPIYIGLTIFLWVGLVVLGEDASIALIHAMSVISTSGISPIGGLYYAHSGFGGEVLIFAFFVFALSRLTFSRGMMGEERTSLWRDPEIRLGLLFIVIVPLFLFLRHFVQSLEDGEPIGALAALQGLWGALFTVASFLTTTGFESHSWTVATDWSQLRTPGLLLVGLALIGGGIATTAGGVKLLRVYALFRHSERELERLVHPSSVGGAGTEARRIRRQGAYISWIFFMLFALSIVGVMVALSLTGVQFENAMVLAVSALSTTGPLAEIAAEDPISFSGIPDAAKIILALTMVLGRLEALAIVALFNPDFWRQ
jgi:trk system potassium uptake protein TrkH